MKKLYEIEVGNIVKVYNLSAKDLLKERLLALGLTKGVSVEVMRKGPKDNLTVYKIRGAMIALRKEEASLITVL
ncbi:ferrous iron transport protein A [Clostridium sp. YIM B02505]|uniref:Ferrous iron transport protein A n=1 Tax=Clostridium yunnanense TaxID=2800325 RepID=A0ABS1EP00_9CLOT|nr:FeoA family protein [Clostridium yunnanense]MBK1811069.1 ferrous iron transport protein A [Clostridium yunnanense]